MSSVIQIKRRLNGAPGSPAEAGAVEGELAVNAQDAANPELWFFGGNTTTGAAPANKGWLQLNPRAPAPTIGNVNLPLTGTPATGTNAGIGTSWTNLAVKPTDPIVIAQYNGGAWIKVGAGTADAHWVSLGSATAVASDADILAGTDNAKMITPLRLRTYARQTPDATPANDADKLVRLNAQGRIDPGFLAVHSLTFRTTTDVTTPYVAPVPAWNAGDFGVVQTGGAIDVSWNAVGLTGQARQGDLIIFDGTNYHLVANEVDLSAYVTLATANAMTANQSMTWAVPPMPGLRTVLDGGDRLKSRLQNFAIETCVIDGGTY